MFKNKFRTYIENSKMHISLTEMDAIPLSPRNPDSVGDGVRDDGFLPVKQFLNIDDKNASDAIENHAMQVIVPDFSKKWGFLVGGTCGAVINSRPDGNYDVTFLLKSKKMLNPRSFVSSEKDDQNRHFKYDGDIEDKTEILSPQELESIFYKKIVGI